jgi:hypothetical protein
MTATSSTVLSNLAYLIGFVVLAVVISLIIWMRHRRPRSVDANMANFRRGLEALAPEPGAPRRSGDPSSEAAAVAATRLTHVRLEPSSRSSSASHGQTEDGEAG